MVACAFSEDEESPYPTLEEKRYTTISYDEEMAMDPKICNPERGLYHQTTFYNSKYPLLMAKVRSDRTLGRSLHLLFFYLTDFMEGDIAPEYLENMQKSFENLRAYGGKAVIRFGYKNSMDAEYSPWDAAPEIVARHIEQVTPIIQENADVIYTIQAGFFGAWGEWHTSTHFTMETPEGAASCREVIIDGLLNALPKDRQVGVRTPSYKMKMLGLTVADSLTISTAHDGTDKSRIGGHNDCFLAGTNDWGTFSDKRGKGDWLYWDTETRYTIMGGETCDTKAQNHHCDKAVKRLAEQHWSYLNNDYHTGVIADWRDRGCYNEIVARIGYRFVLQNAYVTPKRKTKEGGDYRVILNILNDGFAAPMNPRGVELVLVDAAGEEYFYKIDSDPRYWFEGTVTTLDTTITLPDDLPRGKCKLYLNLPDGYESLARNPLYSIRLINKDIWNGTKGYNLITSFEI